MSPGGPIPYCVRHAAGVGANVRSGAGHGVQHHRRHIADPHHPYRRAAQPADGPDHGAEYSALTAGLGNTVEGCDLAGAHHPHHHADWPDPGANRQPRKIGFVA